MGEIFPAFANEASGRPAATAGEAPRVDDGARVVLRDQLDSLDETLQALGISGDFRKKTIDRYVREILERAEPRKGDRIDAMNLEAVLRTVGAPEVLIDCARRYEWSPSNRLCCVSKLALLLIPIGLVTGLVLLLCGQFEFGASFSNGALASLAAIEALAVVLGSITWRLARGRAAVVFGVVVLASALAWRLLA